MPKQALAKEGDRIECYYNEANTIREVATVIDDLQVMFFVRFDDGKERFIYKVEPYTLLKD